MNLYKVGNLNEDYVISRTKTTDLPSQGLEW